MSGRTVVVLGASKDRNKIGNKAVRAYVKGGWTVYPVNHNAHEVEGIKAYGSVSLVPGPIDRVTIYLPPNVVLTLLEEIANIHPAQVYFNPGSDSVEVIRKATSLGLNIISACSIVDIGFSPSQFPGQ